MPEPHDFAVRSALTTTPIGEMPAEVLAKALKRRTSAQRWITHGRTRPATTIAPDAAASTASNPASVTIAIRPSCRGGWASDSGDLAFGESGIFLIPGLDTISENPN